MGTILGIVSAKGGVGKTTAVANLGVALAKEFKRRVLAVDGNITAPNLALYLEMVRPPVTIFDVLEKNIPITHAIFSHNSGLDVVPGSIRELDTINTDNLGYAIQTVSEQYDMVLLDSSPSVGTDVISVLKASDELLIVTVPEFLIVATTYKTVNLARTLGKPIRGIILNKVRGKKYEMTKEEVEETVGLPVIGVIQEDSKIRESVNHGLSVVEQYPKSKPSRQFKTLAANLVGEEYVAGFFAKVNMLISLWKDILFEKEETKIEQWQRRGEEVWAGRVSPQMPLRGMEEPIEISAPPELKPEYEPEIALRPEMEIRPASRPEPIVRPKRRPEPEPIVQPEPKSIEAAIERLSKNYKDGLLAEPVYKDLKVKYKEELKKLRGF
jgi:MinD-like ATPase involved in chromosome partitioning or flagellar assembly